MSGIQNRKHSVLLFDYECDFAENIKIYLEDIYEVKTVCCPKLLISELKKGYYDILVSDCNPSNSQFMSFINEISNISDTTKIILMCTFFDAEIDNERNILSKVDDYIFKPFNVNLLEYKLSRLYGSGREINLV